MGTRGIFGSFFLLGVLDSSRVSGSEKQAVDRDSFCNLEMCLVGFYDYFIAVLGKGCA